MILSQFVGAAMRPEPHCGEHTPESRAPQWGNKMAQKGDFSGAGIFASPSLAGCMNCLALSFCCFFRRNGCWLFLFDELGV